jgi:uncharacterized protein YunC (DUF1805 family)
MLSTARPPGMLHQRIVANGIGGTHAFFHMSPASIRAAFLAAQNTGIAIGLQLHANLKRHFRRPG